MNLSRRDDGTFPIKKERSLDAVQSAAVSRARSALEIAGSDSNSREAQAKAFIQIAYTMLGSKSTAEALRWLKASPNDLIQRAAAHGLGDAVWDDGEAQALAASYVASVAEFSLLDQLIRYARILPIGQRTGLIASGFSANVVAEAGPKVVKRLSLSNAEVSPVKCAAIVVLTNELAAAIKEKGLRLFERELQESVSRATNQAVLSELVTTESVHLPGTGDPISDMRAGLRAAGASNGYVVAASAGDVVDLATRVENRGGMGVRGGTFIPGVEIVAVDDLSEMHVIPASRLALWDQGLRIRSAGHATVNMADTPSSPSQHVSLWQDDLVGLLAERNFHIAGDLSGVVVVGGS